MALRVLMDQRRDDFDERRRVRTENLEQLCSLLTASPGFSDRAEVALLDVMRQTLNDIANPMLDGHESVLDQTQGLSRRSTRSSSSSGQEGLRGRSLTRFISLQRP